MVTQQIGYFTAVHDSSVHTNRCPVFALIIVLCVTLCGCALNSLGGIGGCTVTCLLSLSNQLHLMCLSGRFHIPWGHDNRIRGLASIIGTSLAEAYVTVLGSRQYSPYYLFWNLPKMVTPIALGIQLSPIINKIYYIWYLGTSKEY
jgi:hypothetical protein